KRIIICALMSIAHFVYGQQYKYLPIPHQYMEIINNSAKVPSAELYDITQSLPAGYVKNGSVDYTQYIQKALDDHNKVMFPDFPILINDAGLSVRSNTKLFF